LPTIDINQPRARRHRPPVGRRLLLPTFPDRFCQ
jgi:hypothetical protein